MYIGTKFLHQNIEIMNCLHLRHYVNNKFLLIFFTILFVVWFFSAIIDVKRLLLQFAMRVLGNFFVFIDGGLFHYPPIYSQYIFLIQM